MRNLRIIQVIVPFRDCLICILFLSGIISTNLHSQISGTVDPTFGNEGCVEIKDPTNNYSRVSAELTPDGKIIVMAFGAKVQLTLMRLLPDGSRDNTFGTEGHNIPDLNISYGVWGRVEQCILDHDGKLILVGGSNPNPSIMKGAAFVARLNATGTLDTTFGQNGLLLLDVGSFLDKFRSILVKPDGKILLGGVSYDFGSQLLLVQLLPDGSLDPDFATGGIYLSKPDLDSRSIYGLALQQDGKIVAFGSFRMEGNLDTKLEVWRFHANGTPDSTFVVDRSRLLSSLPYESSMAYSGVIQPDQKIVFSGTSVCTDTPNSLEGEVTLHRLNNDGSLDTTFGTDGAVFTDFGLLVHRGRIVLQADGKILVATAAYSLDTRMFNFWLARYNTDGSLDHTFGHGGKVKSPNYGGAMGVGNILLDKEGKIVYAGIAESKVVLWRYLNENTTTAPPSVSSSPFQIRPNPVFDEGMVSWAMEKPGELRGDLFDAQGQLVKQLIPPAFYNAGAHQRMVSFDKDLPPGVYFLAFTAGNNRQLLKVVKF